MTTSPASRPSSFLRFVAATSLLILALVCGCEHDSHDDGHSSSSGSSSAIVGSWRLVGTDGSVWYVHFGDDGNWKISDDAEGAARRVYGTYTSNGSSFSGPMVNPGIGEGQIEGTLDGDLMTMDFIEYWHTPAKHVPYSGTKL